MPETAKICRGVLLPFSQAASSGATPNGPMSIAPRGDRVLHRTGAEEALIARLYVEMRSFACFSTSFRSSQM